MWSNECILWPPLPCMLSCECHLVSTFSGLLCHVYSAVNVIQWVPSLASLATQLWMWSSEYLLWPPLPCSLSCECHPGVPSLASFALFTQLWMSGLTPKMEYRGHCHWAWKWDGCIHTHTHIFHAVLLYKQRSGWRGKNIEGLGVGPGILPTTVGVHMLCDQW